MTIHAGLDATAGRTAEALAGYREALRLWRELHLDFEIARAGLEFATMLPNEAQAREAAEESLRIFQRLGARPFAERTAALLGQPARPTKGRSRSAREPQLAAAADAPSEPASETASA